MLEKLHISGFRSFPELMIDQLTRVNLFVGKNNVGKTSILDAAELLAVGTAPAVFRSPIRRRERVFVDREEGSETARHELDLSHLFHGHKLKLGDSFRLSADSKWVQCDVVEQENGELPQLLQLNPSEPIVVLRFRSNVEERSLPISPLGGVSDSFRRRAIPPSPREERPLVNFLGTEVTSPFRLSQLWDSIVLTPQEEGVVGALRIVEPAIERIAFAGSGPLREILLKLAGTDQRLPLGTAGDGLKRLLVLALHLFSARGGFLLVDEIDTGLHYTAMADMWRLVIETAKRLDVQVFATTHSLDCVRALAWIQEERPYPTDDVRLHRVERELTHTMEYTLDEISVAARNYLEVR